MEENQYSYKYSVRDPIHGPIPFTEVEKEIMDTLQFQRLRNIVQNSMCYRVFSGARHTRFEHSIGVMHLAGRLFDTLNRADKPFLSFSEAYGLDAKETGRMRQVFRLGSMLHDIGHGPFSHAAEALPDAKDHEAWSLEFIINDPIKAILEKHDIDPELVQLVGVEVKDPPVGPMNLDKRTAVIAQLNQLLTGEFGVDRMDYLLRDSYYCGVRYGMFEVERLIESMHLFLEKGNIILVLGADGVSAAEALTFARFQMFSSVYFHKTVNIMNWHLNKFVEGQWKGKQYPQELEEYALYDDCDVHKAMNAAARDINHPEHLHATALLTRQHFRMAWETTHEVIYGLGISKPDQFIHDELEDLGLKKDVDYVYRVGNSKSQSYAASEIKVYQNEDVQKFSGAAPIAAAIPKIKFARVYVPKNSTHKQAVRTALKAWAKKEVDSRKE